MNRPIVSTWKISPSTNAPTVATFAAIPLTSAWAFAICRRIVLLVSLVSNHRCVDARLPPASGDQLLHLVDHERDHEATRPAPGGRVRRTTAAAILRQPRHEPVRGRLEGEREEQGGDQPQQVLQPPDEAERRVGGEDRDGDVRSRRGIHAGMLLSRRADGRPPRRRVWASARVGSASPAARVSGGGRSRSGGVHPVSVSTAVRGCQHRACAGSTATMNACAKTPRGRPGGRPRRGTSRDGRGLLGRPRPWDAANALELEDFDSLTVEENHRREHLNAGRFFPAHEAWETAWKQSRDTADAEFFKGLSQLGAGYVHLLEGMRTAQSGCSGEHRDGSARTLRATGGSRRPGRGRGRCARGRRRDG